MLRTDQYCKRHELPTTNCEAARESSTLPDTRPLRYREFEDLLGEWSASRQYTPCKVQPRALRMQSKLGCFPIRKSTTVESSNILLCVGARLPNSHPTTHPPNAKFSHCLHHRHRENGLGPATCERGPGIASGPAQDPGASGTQVFPRYRVLRVLP